MTDSHDPHNVTVTNHKPLVAAIVAVTLAYATAVAMHAPFLYPDHASHESAAEAPGAKGAVKRAAASVAAQKRSSEDHRPAGPTTRRPDAATTPEALAPEDDLAVELEAEQARLDAERHPHDEHADHHEPPPVVMVTPFILLLGCIAILPLLRSTEHWWESNLHRFYVAAGLGLVTLAYYLIADGGTKTWHVVEHALLLEYIPFITLLFSLYTISGGIRIECDLRALPSVNVGFLLVGGLLASFIGTTGAAMLLIRPLLETNIERRRVRHTVVFFIFVVCNCGGCLLPLGDPPLFLGYLRGVDFWWTMSLWREWLFMNVSLLAVYFAWDSWAYRQEEKPDIDLDDRLVRPLRFSGWLLNGLLLAGVVVSVAFLDPSKTLPGVDWHPWPYLREVVQLVLVALSLALGPAGPRLANKFNYLAILEVAALFVGIFICMTPALELLNHHGDKLGVDSPTKFFWMTGLLSSVLDNAPTYVVFFQTAKTLPGGTAITSNIDAALLTAISLGAVFMGANTYIGNGPNFMVRAIAEKSGVRMPSFFGYIGYSMAVLVPLYLVMTLIFLR